VAPRVGALTGPATVSPAMPALLRLCRPRQWVKNLLVFAAPAAASVLNERDAALHTIGAFVAFTLVASGTYCVNDVADRHADRDHPTKHRRPVATGEVSVGAALTLGVVLLVAGVVGGLLIQPQLGAVVLAYVAITACYNRWWRHVVIVDLVAIAAGFVLRAIAGAAATDIPISDWFFIVTCFGALFVAAGKRSGEMADLDLLEAPPRGDAGDAAPRRATLDAYTPTFLAYLRATCSGVMLVAYCLWAFEKAAVADGSIPWFELSIVPMAMAVLRYAFLLDRGEGGTPERLFVEDRELMVFAALWAVVFGLGLVLT
jgi:decaprenyl-phosphate phosphoribosyltransferase